MAATSMPPINSLVNSLQAAYPALKFQADQDSPCRWSPASGTIFYEPADTAVNKAVLLHEVAHAVLHHDTYRRDIELLSKERAAWQLAATTLSQEFGVQVPAELIDQHLDTYRDWLHERSLCPSCRQTGIQTKAKTYSCINCRSSWRVNDGRQCQLRRWNFTA